MTAATRIFSTTPLSASLRKQIFLHGSPNLIQIVDIYPEDNLVDLNREIRFPLFTSCSYQQGENTFHKIPCKKGDLMPWSPLPSASFQWYISTLWLPWDLRKGDLIWQSYNFPFAFPSKSPFYTLPVYMA